MRVIKFGFVMLLAGISFATSAEDGKSQGQVLYEQNCGSCHQMDGGGVPMLQPELIDRPRANGAIGGVIEMMLFGSDAMATNESDYSNEMPSFAHLTDIEIALIASYVRTHFENNGGPVTAGDVKSRRAQ